MGAIHVEGIEEQVLTSIALRAQQNGRSLDEEVRAILEAAAGPPAPRLDLSHLKTRAERFAAIRAMTPKGVEQTDSTEIIREMRDRGYADY